MTVAPLVDFRIYLNAVISTPVNFGLVGPGLDSNAECSIRSTRYLPKRHSKGDIKGVFIWSVSKRSCSGTLESDDVLAVMELSEGPNRAARRA